MASTSQTSRWAALGLTALGPASWGTTYLVTTEWLPPGRPLLDAAVRALPAGLVILAVTRVLPRGLWWAKASLLGILNIGAFFALLFVAAYRLPGGVAATLGALQPLLVASLSVVLLRQRVSRRTVLAGLVGVAGIALLVLRADARLDAQGLLAGILATASMALGVVLVKRWGRPVGVGLVPFTGWLLASGGLFLVPVALVGEGPPPALTMPQVGGFAYMAVVSTTFAYVVWLRGIERLPATSVAFLPLLAPVVATLLGWAVLGQGLNPAQGLGLLLALGAMVAGQSGGTALTTRLRVRRQVRGPRARFPLAVPPSPVPQFTGWLRDRP